MYKGLYIYAWDLADEGLETVLGRIRPTGINTITLAASYHAGKFLRPHGVSGKVYFPKDGTVYFQARPERYGHIKPLVNPLVDEFDAFALLAQGGAGSRAASPGWCAATTRRSASSTPSSPAATPSAIPISTASARPIRRCATTSSTSCADLADRHDLAGVALETPGWLPYDHGYHHEFALRAARPLRQDAARALLRRRHAQRRARRRHRRRSPAGARPRAARALSRAPTSRCPTRSRPSGAGRGRGRSRARGLPPLALPRGRGPRRRRQGRRCRRRPGSR